MQDGAVCFANLWPLTANWQAAAGDFAGLTQPVVRGDNATELAASPSLGPPCHTDASSPEKKNAATLPPHVAPTVSLEMQAFSPCKLLKRGAGKPVGRLASSFFDLEGSDRALGSGMGCGGGGRGVSCPSAESRAASTCSEAPTTSHLKVMLVHHMQLHKALEGEAVV